MASMSLDAVCGIASYVEREYGGYGYRLEELRGLGYSGASVALVAHSDGSRFVVEADRDGNAHTMSGYRLAVACEAFGWMSDVQDVIPLAGKG